jgi:hypothetical protein
LTITVKGLQGLKEKIEVKLVNGSPGVISIDKGEAQTLSIKPSDVTTDGTYQTNRGLKGIVAGGFNITATLRV